MFLTTTSYVMMIMGWLFLMLWLVLFFLGKKHTAVFDILKEEEYPLKELYGLGYAFMEMIRYPYRSNRDRILRRDIGILYTEKYVEYYIRVVYAQQVTFALTLIVLAFVLYGLSGEFGIVLVLLLFSGLSAYYFGTLPAKRIAKRSEEMMTDFAEVISNLALLTNAGMVLREAWEEVAFSDTGVIYREMQIVVNDMNNGISEADALYRFGLRCVVPSIKKFSSTIIQGVEKGNRELVQVLQGQSSEIWSEKKQDVRRQGEKAAAKLMIPVFIMFAGILIMVVVPIFTNMLG